MVLLCRVVPLNHSMNPRINHYIHPGEIALVFCILVVFLSGCRTETKMKYAPSPLDNPLKGLVPYVESDSRDRFPHSLEFRYFALSDLMKGPAEFDWSPLEDTLQITSGRGCQLITRIFLEYPDKPGIPQFLIDSGLKITEWDSDDGKNITPNYEDPNLRKALQAFIAAFADRYDNDPRLGYLTAGLLGLWGEWHTYPRSELFASREVQTEVLTAYARDFKKLPVLLRYPAGDDHYAYVKNTHLPFGYHDDSFAWATLDTGKEVDSWFFIPLLAAAGALDRWKTHPIGGELRPELWSTSFTGQSPSPAAQDFSACVAQTHVTWLMDSGLFEERFPMSPERKKRAISEVSQMGYSFYVSKWMKKGTTLEITIENRGVAPIYRDWEVYLNYSGIGGLDLGQFDETFNLKGILPGESRIWKVEIPKAALGQELTLHAPNEMKGGKPLRFANETQGESRLSLGTIK